jgi:hypothetical protein
MSHPLFNDYKVDSAIFNTTFNLILEPLIFGIIPKSVIPTIYLILIFAGSAALVVPYIIKFLEGINSKKLHKS